MEGEGYTIGDIYPQESRGEDETTPKTAKWATGGGIGPWMIYLEINFGPDAR